MSRTISEYCEICNAIARAKGFWEKERNIPEMIMLVVTELSEAVEGLRHNDYDNFKEEIADTFIRLFDLCGGLMIDIEKEIDRKIDINKCRATMHGKEF